MIGTSVLKELKVVLKIHNKKKEHTIAKKLCIFFAFTLIAEISTQTLKCLTCKASKIHSSGENNINLKYACPTGNAMKDAFITYRLCIFFRYVIKSLVDKHNHEGDTALYKAAYYGHVQICNLLLENNASVNQKTNKGVTALLVGAQNRHVDVCTLLLQNNAQVNQQDNNGTSALWIAAQNGHVDVCSLLLQNNAQVNQQNNNGTSAYIMSMYAPCYFRTMHKSINKIIMEDLHCGLQRKTVMLMYAPCYFRTTHLSIIEIKMEYFLCT